MFLKILQRVGLSGRQRRFSASAGVHEWGELREQRGVEQSPWPGACIVAVNKRATFTRTLSSRGRYTTTHFRENIYTLSCTPKLRKIIVHRESRRLYACVGVSSVNSRGRVNAGARETPRCFRLSRRDQSTIYASFAPILDRACWNLSSYEGASIRQP